MTIPELRLRCLETNPDFQFLPEKDRYLTQRRNATLNLGLVGCGTIGLEHIRITGLDEQAQVAAVFDLDLSIAQQAAQYTQDRFGYTPEVCHSLDDLVNLKALDGYIICTPNHTHLSIFRRLANTQKPIYIEKPMAHTLEDAIQLYHLAQDYSAPLHIGLQYRFKPQYTELFSALETNTIGKALNIRCVENRPPFLDKVNQWNKYNRYSGGTLVEKCCHYFNLIHRVAGTNPVNISCFSNQSHNFKTFSHDQPSDIIDSAQVNIEFEDGVLAHLSLCMFSPSFYEELSVCGSNGQLKAIEEDNLITGKPHKCQLEKLMPEDGITSVSYPSYGKIIAESGHHGSTFKAHQLFIQSIIESDAPGHQYLNHFPTHANLKESLWSIVMGHAAQHASKTNQVIAIQDILGGHNLEFLTE